MKFILKCIKIFFRMCAFLLLLVSAVLVVAAIAIKVLITPESLKAIFTDQIQEALHRPVQIESVRFLISQGIQVRGLKVLESANYPDREFIFSDVLLAKYNWKALLQRRLEINELELVGPRIRLARGENSRWNIEDLFVSSSSAKSAAVPGPVRLPVALAADRISINDGVLIVRDIKRGRDYSILGFDLRVRGFNESKPFGFHVSFENSDRFGGAIVHSKISSEGSVALAGFQWENAALFVDRLRCSVEGKQAVGTLSVRNFLHPRVELKMRAPEMDSGFLAHFSAKAPAGLAVPAGQWRASLSFPTTSEFRIDSLEVSAPPLEAHLKGALKQTPSAIRYGSTISFSPFALDEASAVWRGADKYGLQGVISGELALKGSVRPARGSNDHSFKLDKISLRLKNFGGKFFENYRLSQVDADIAGSDNLQALSAGVLRGKVSFYGTTLSGLDARLSVEQGNLDLERLNFAWDISHVKLKGRVTGLDPPTEVALDGSVDKIKLDPLIAAIERLWNQTRPSRHAPRTGPWAHVFKYSFPRTFPAISGHLRVGEVAYPNFESFNLDGTWNLRGIATGLNKVNGSIQVGFGPGRVFDIPALEKDNKILRVVFLPFVFMHKLNNLTVISLNTAYPKTLDYNRIFGEYRLNRGIVDVRMFHVDSAPLVAYADGKVDFPNEKINLHMLTRLNRARGSLPEYLTDQKGRPSIGFFVEDNLNNPTLRIEYHKMEEDAIEKALQRGVQHAQGGGK